MDPNVTIMEGARIGKNCDFSGAVVSAPPQDLKYKGEETLTFVGDNTTIRECVTIIEAQPINIKRLLEVILYLWLCSYSARL